MNVWGGEAAKSHVTLCNGEHSVAGSRISFAWLLLKIAKQPMNQSAIDRNPGVMAQGLSVSRIRERTRTFKWRLALTLRLAKVQILRFAAIRAPRGRFNLIEKWETQESVAYGPKRLNQIGGFNKSQSWASSRGVAYA